MDTSDRQCQPRGGTYFAAGVVVTYFAIGFFHWTFCRQEAKPLQPEAVSIVALDQEFEKNALLLAHEAGHLLKTPLMTATISRSQIQNAKSLFGPALYLSFSEYLRRCAAVRKALAPFKQEHPIVECPCKLSWHEHPPAKTVQETCP